MRFLEKLQRQPEHIKKIILWATVIIITLGLLVWWVKSISQKIREFEGEEFIEELNLPSFEEELKGL